MRRSRTVVRPGAPDNKWRDGPCLVWALAGVGLLASISWSVWHMLG
jgi:hypothetical protein